MPKTIRTLLETAEKHIPALDARMLLAHVLGERIEYLLAHGERTVAHSREWFYRLLVFRRQRRIPAAYLTGHKEFFGLDFFVNRHVLIPRPETELMVELALDRMRNYELGMRNTVLIDVGTGSGCVPIAILKNAKNQEIQKTIALDSSKKALEVAKRNAARHGVNITFLHGNLLEPILLDFSNLTSDFSHIIVTANLPYLTPKQFQEEPSIQQEPRSALVGGFTGLELYEKLLTQLQSLNAIRYTLNALFEIDPTQSDAMKTLIKKYLPSASVEVYQDLAGRNRVVSAAQPQSKSSPV